MPHNNRMSTSGALKTSDIWSKTIGHDPHASAQHDAAVSTEEERAMQAAKAESVMKLAREQNLTGDRASRDDFARKMYLGLKGGKKQRATDDNEDAEARYQKLQLQAILEQPDSSSEDELVEEDNYRETGAKERKSDRTDRRKSKKHKRHKKHQKRRENSDSDSSSTDTSSNSSSDDSDDESSHRKHKSKKSRRRKRHRSSRKKSRSSSSSSDDESSSEDERRRSKSKKKHRSKKKKKQRKHSIRDEVEESESSNDRKESFIPAEQFEGSKRGYVFKNGENGVGYYIDSGKQTYSNKLSR